MIDETPKEDEDFEEVSEFYRSDNVCTYCGEIRRLFSISRRPFKIKIPSETTRIFSQVGTKKWIITITQDSKI